MTRLHCTCRAPFWLLLAAAAGALKACSAKSACLLGSQQAQLPTHLQPLRLVAHGLRRADACLDGRHKLQVSHQPHLGLRQGQQAVRQERASGRRGNATRL